MEIVVQSSVHKALSRRCVANNRRFASLPTIINLFELVVRKVHTHHFMHFFLHNITGRSSVTNLLKFLNYSINVIHTNQIYVVFIDIRKAFDCILKIRFVQACHKVVTYVTHYFSNTSMPTIWILTSPGYSFIVVPTYTVILKYW